MCFGLALLGFASAAYSGASKHTDATGTSTCSISAITNASLSVSGNAAQATFTVRSDCDAVEVSLVSYTMPGPAFDENTADQQALSASTTVTVGAGSHTLSLAVPNCFYQVDFVVGQPLQTLGPAGSGNFYSSQGRYIASATGGSTPCSTTTTTTTTATTTTTPAMTTPTTTTEATTTAPGTTTTTTHEHTGYDDGARDDDNGGDGSAHDRDGYDDDRTSDDRTTDDDCAVRAAARPPPRRRRHHHRL